MVANESGASGGVCLCVLFNHPFVANVPVLRAIYGKRFSHVRYLMPFERCDDPEVLTVYRGSFAHCAYAAEHLAELQSLNCSHYVFIHDDVLLSPYLDETNILGHLGVSDSGDGYIGGLWAVNPDIAVWGYQIGSFWRLAHPTNHLSGTGVESFATVMKYLPPAAEAAKKAERYDIPPVVKLAYNEGSFSTDVSSNFRYFGLQRRSDAAFIKGVAERLFDSPAPASAEIPYPISCSGPWTDFYVVPGAKLGDFLHIAATLATAGLFVEMAAPTALMLACDFVATADDLGVAAHWATEFVPPREALSMLVRDRNITIVHPVKFSQLTEVDSFIAMFDLDGPAIPAILNNDYQTLVEMAHPGFDPHFYLSNSPDLIATNAPPYEHFYRFGYREGRAWKRDD